MPGWDELDALAAAGEPLPDPDKPDALEEVDNIFVAALNNPAGQRLLRFWKKQYLDQPVCVPGAGAEVGFHREGQNSVVREAIQRLIRGTQPKT
jgi:hypothetical protein